MLASAAIVAGIFGILVIANALFKWVVSDIKWKQILAKILAGIFVFAMLTALLLVTGQ